MKRFAEILGGLASVVLALGLVVAVPVLLGPWTIDRFRAVTDVIDDPLASDSTRVETFLTAGLLLVFWLAWAMLVVALITEAVALAKGRAARRLPLLPGIQPAAARLVASCALVLSSFAGAMPTTVEAAPITPLTTTEQVVDLDTVAVTNLGRDRDEILAVANGPTYEAQRGDTWWSLGERFLDDGMRWGEIVAANSGVTMPDGAVISTATPNPVEGWTLRLPVGVNLGDGQGATVGTPIFRSYTVQANDGMWDVADALLGDGSRHAELHDQLIGQEVAPGVIFDADTRVIHEGWTFTYVPSEHAGRVADLAVLDTVHVVERGDTLTGIAEDHLGDGDEWPSIFEANAGRDMGDGRRFDDPNLIVPGWEIEMPVAAAGTTDVVEPAEGGLAVPRSDGAGGPQLELQVIEVPAPPVEDHVAPVEERVAEEIVRGALPPPSLPAATVPTTTMPTLSLVDSVDSAEPGRESSAKAPSLIRLEHAALLAAGLLTLVGVRRRQRLRTSNPRARVPEPPANVVATERRWRTTDTGERAARVDVAIRAAAHALTDLDAQVAVVSASLDGVVEVHLTGPATLPSPWVGHGATWRLDASVPIEMLAEVARRVNTPTVALVQLGVATDGSDVLVDLEACGTFAVEARPSQGDEVVTAIAAGLATSPYAETAHLIGVALPPTALLDHRNAFHVGSLDAGFDMASSLVGSTVTNPKTTFALRALHTSGEMWEPAVIVATSSTRAEFFDDQIVLPRPGHGIALVASVSPGMIDAAPGRLVAGVYGWKLTVFGSSTSLTPIGLSGDDLADIGDVLLDADSPLVEPTVEETGDAERTLAEVGARDLGDFVPMPHEIVVRLLGSIEVRSGLGEIGKFERSKTVELIAWLATHREKSTRSAARTALWELDVRDATFANVVSEARRALARLVPPAEGEEWVARTLTEQLPLHCDVVTDAQLIQERLDAARLQPPNAAIATLRPAAEMIVDMPFAGANYLWPDAEGLTSSLVLLATSVTAELAAHALSIGDTDLVFWATGQGLAVLPGHEELIGLRMQAHAQAGDLAGVRQEWESYERVIVADAWTDGEPAPKLLNLRRQLLASS